MTKAVSSDLRQKLIRLKESLIRNGVDGFAKLSDGTVVLRSFEGEELAEKMKDNGFFCIPEVSFEVELVTKESLPRYSWVREITNSGTLILCISAQIYEKDHFAVSKDKVLWADNWTGEKVRFFEGKEKGSLLFAFQEECFQIEAGRVGAEKRLVGRYGGFGFEH